MVDDPDSPVYLTLEEITIRCDVDRQFVEALVRYGVVEPVRREPPTFPRDSTLRIGKAARLQRDLGVNPAGAAVILDLLDRIEELEGELRTRVPRRGR